MKIHLKTDLCVRTCDQHAPKINFKRFWQSKFLKFDSNLVKTARISKPEGVWSDDDPYASRLPTSSKEKGKEREAIHACLVVTCI
jgi:hypothetical protein